VQGLKAVVGGMATVEGGRGSIKKRMALTKKRMAWQLATKVSIMGVADNKVGSG
jgi:hypothetical protein